VFLCDCGDVCNYDEDSKCNVDGGYDGNGNYEDGEDDCGDKRIIERVNK
jgi:hypothetical protein